MNQFLAGDIVAAVESALSEIDREGAQDISGDADVSVAYAAGDWDAMKAAVAVARDKMTFVQMHNIADAAGVMSHTAQGQPIDPAKRLDGALAAMDQAEADLKAAVSAQQKAPVDAIPPAQ